MSKHEDIMRHLGITEDDFKPKDNNAKLQALMDIVSVDRYQSDKLGYDFDVIKVGDVEVKKTYVAQINPIGTADNPFTNKDVLINNAFYLIDGVRYVYMDGQFAEF